MGTNTLYSLNILKQLKESGIIESTKAHIVIKNFEKLLEEECQPARQTEKQGKKKGRKKHSYKDFERSRGIFMIDLQAHIRLSKEDAAKYAILPGDPGRIDHIKTFLTESKELAYNREMRSVSGYYKGLKVLAVSTGMGGASTGIAVEELHNIGVKYMIRIGSCGGLDPRMKFGDLLIVNGAVRDEGASKAYIDSIYPAIPDTELLISVLEAANECKVPFFIGKARSHDSFYIDNKEEISKYWSGKGIMGSDMETAALFTIGALRGVKTASILNTVVEYEGNLAEEINGYVDGEASMKQGEKNEILLALEAFVKEENKINNKRRGYYE